MSKGEHLVPPPVLDMIEKLQKDNLGGNERMALVQRLETTRDFITKALERDQRSKRK